MLSGKKKGHALCYLNQNFLSEIKSSGQAIKCYLSNYTKLDSPDYNNMYLKNAVPLQMSVNNIIEMQMRGLN